MTLMKIHCKLQRCSKLFKQNRKWQVFCEPAHQKEYWKNLYKERYTLASRMDKVEKKLGIK